MSNKDKPVLASATQTRVMLKHKSSHSLRNKLVRGVWAVVYQLLFRPSPRVCHGWRRLLLRAFGARMGKNAIVYPTAKIWIPMNLEIGESSCVGPDVDCYCVDRIVIGKHCVISQYSYLCTASHDHRSTSFDLVTAPIHICDQAWVAADVFIGPAVTVGEGAVVGARTSVFKSVKPWTIVGGNPARFIKIRELVSSDTDYLGQ